MEHAHHDQHQQHAHHESHDTHAGHNPSMFKKKFFITLLLALPVLAYSMTVQQLLHIVPPAFPGSEWLPPVFGVIIFGYGGIVFLKSARVELANRQPGMMTLISLAITVAFTYSLAISLRWVAGMDFWWELATLIAIMLLGHWLEMAAIARTQAALHELTNLLPDTAERITANGTQMVALHDIRVNDHLLVRPGASIPADGEVIDGESDVNESLLTGESKPVKKIPNAPVTAGTINGSGAITIQVTKTGDDTALAGIARLVAEAQQSKSRTQILADTAARYLTFVAIGAALITWIAWALVGESASYILERVVTVLVIACPHALGLAVPLVTAISTTKAARSGILVRQRLALEAARNIDVVLFDKTGTLTEGKQGVVNVLADNPKQLLALAASAESKSEHTLSRAIVAHAKTEGITVSQPTQFTALAGRGVLATVNGQKIYVGGPKLLQELHVGIPENFLHASDKATHDGKTVVYVSDGRIVVGIIMLADVIRPESRQAITGLHAADKRIALVTGDVQGVAAWVAAELGISEVFAEILPNYKAKVVRELQKNGAKVAMVGDGVNDAPALAQADIGIAIGGGTDVAIASASIVLASNDPRGVVKIINLSRATYRKMQQNIAWAVGYNLIAIPLAAGVGAHFDIVLSPAVGAVLMSLSTIIVAINAQFLRRTKI